MTCDRLLPTEVVTVAGDIVTASETDNADLFWAVRGTRAATLACIPPSPTAWCRQVMSRSSGWPGRVGIRRRWSTPSFLHMQLHAPRELGLRLAAVSQSRMPLFQPAPLDVNTLGLYWGSLAELEELLAPVERVQAADSRTVERMHCPAAREFLSATTPTGAYQVKSGFVQGMLPAQGLATMLEWIATMPGVPSRA